MHFQHCNLETKHEMLQQELEAVKAAMAAKEEQMAQVKAALEQASQREAEMRQQILSKAKLQLSTRLEIEANDE